MICIFKLMKIIHQSRQSIRSIALNIERKKEQTSRMFPFALSVDNKTKQSNVVFFAPQVFGRLGFNIELKIVRESADKPSQD